MGALDVKDAMGDALTVIVCVDVAEQFASLIVRVIVFVPAVEYKMPEGF